MPTKLALSIVLHLFIGFAGSLFTRNSIDNWYSTLAKPPITPPAWAFAPVWTTLYILMAISLYLIWESKKSKKKAQALKIYYFHLFLNFLWSVLFFGLQAPFLALLEILILLAFIGILIIKFRKINVVASNLLIPYFAWVTLATCLNFSIWYLN